MDAEEQNELRRKRLRILDGAGSPNTDMNVLDDAIMARQLALDLDRKPSDNSEPSAASARSSGTPQPLQQPHPGEDEVRAAHANGEYSEVFSTLIRFDDTAKHNKPVLVSKRPEKPTRRGRTRRDNGTGYGGDDYYDDFFDDEYNPITGEWLGPKASPFVGKGQTLDTWKPSTYDSLAPSAEVDDTQSKPKGSKSDKSKKSGGFGSLFGLKPKKPKKLPSFNNFAGQGHALGSDAPHPQSTSKALDQSDNVSPKADIPGTFGAPSLVPHSLLSQQLKTSMPQPSPFQTPLPTSLPQDSLSNPFPKSPPPHADSGGAQVPNAGPGPDIDFSYFGGYKKRHQKLELKPEEPIKPDDDDLMTAGVFGRLTELMPAHDGSSPDINTSGKSKDKQAAATSDVLPSIIRCSTILDRAAELLRHSTLEEIVGKSGLFQKLTDFIVALIEHPLTAPLVLDSRIAHKPGHSLKNLIQHVPNPNISDLSASSLIMCMRPIAKIADDELNNPDIDASIVGLLCRINSTYKQLTNDTMAVSIHQPNPNAWQANLRFAQLPDNVITATHSLFMTTAMTETATKRMSRITKEIKDLRTNLPDGIFVRVAESRPDYMKILMIGPQGTPYENGLFEFDLVYPAQFPLQPPIMKFKTTGGGRIRFNPNLYQDGKVCLSLLGTWEGENWDPEKSTTRQVLVSIQAMILCEMPWRNEPGRETVPDGDPSLDDYNQALRPMTIKHAMLGWLEEEKKVVEEGEEGEEEEEEGEKKIWGEVVEKHFSTKEKEIASCVSAWAAAAKSKPAGFKGTGWAGMALGDEEKVVKSEEEGEVAAGLVAHLKGVLPVLQAGHDLDRISMW